MDRVEFLHSINMNGRVFSDTIIGFFDQHYILYNIIEDIASISICNSNANNIVFELYYNNDSELSTSFQSLSEIRSYSVFDKVYSINVQKINENTLTVQMSICK